jgi:hypothetical protein
VGLLSRKRFLEFFYFSISDKTSRHLHASEMPMLQPMLQPRLDGGNVKERVYVFLNRHLNISPKYSTTHDGEIHRVTNNLR